MALLSIVFCCIGMIIWIFPITKRYNFMNTWASIFTVLTKKICKVNYIIKGNVKLIKAPMVIVSNHQSMWETAGLAHILPYHATVLKKELLIIPFFGWGLATLRPIAINRKKRGEVTLQIASQAKTAFKNGLNVLFFPEGTRASPNKINSFKLGAFRLAKSFNIPIVAVTHNAGYVLPRSGYLIYPGTVEIIIENPIYDIEQETVESLKERVENIIRVNFDTIRKKN